MQVAFRTVSEIINSHLDRLLAGDVCEADYLSDRESAWVEHGNSGFIRERIPYYADPEMREKLIDRFNEIEVADGFLVLYRGISHPEDELPKSIGVCWTFDQKKAYCYGTKDKLPCWFKYHAFVKPSSVNWFHTIQKGMVLHNHEKEVRLIEGAPMLVFKRQKFTKTICDLLEEKDFCLILEA